MRCPAGQTCSVARYFIRLCVVLEDEPGCVEAAIDIEHVAADEARIGRCEEESRRSDFGALAIAAGGDAVVVGLARGRSVRGPALVGIDGPGRNGVDAHTQR